MWGYGITSDVSGRLSDMDEQVLFDMFIVAHEVGHSLGSGHTFDSYDPPVDRCDLCSEADPGATIDGLPRENAATIMSYCNFCQGESPTSRLDRSSPGRSSRFDSIVKTHLFFP